MKKILLTTLCFGAIQLFAGTPQWVKTTVEKKNVVLEEFTGIHCGYCPDGHKIANGMVAANPGRVFLINIHSGGYAVPGAGELDLRTSAGTAIDGASGITGYPAGSINRTKSPWSEGRGGWVTTAAGVLAQTSPVNVAVKSSVDFATRKLTTEVEVYYTSNSAQAKNYLTVALTQDDILGTQSDYGNYNPTNWVDGKYRHNHVLRQLITAANFGDVIDTTKKDYYMYKKFVTDIPTNYIGVDVALYKLNVVAFVSESANGGNILSAAETAVDFDPNLKTDLKLTDLTVKPTGYCFTTVNPKVEVTNNFDQTITSFEVSAIVNGVENKKTFTGTLLKDAKTTLDWGDIAVTNTGTFSLKIQGFKNISNGTGIVYDMDNTNDNSSMDGLGFKSAAFTTFKNGFESGTPANMAFDLSQNPNAQILTGTAPALYGEHGSKSAFVFKLHSSWNSNGKPASIVLGEADFTSNDDPGIAFSYAYSDDNFGGTAPTIAVSASDDCGATWATIKTITAVETGSPTTSGNYYDPKAGEYIYVNTSLSSYKGRKALLKITGTPGTAGNALFIDEINVNTFTKLAVAEKVKTNQFEIFPNPATNNFTVVIANAKNATISVKDLTGKEVIRINAKGIESTIDCNQLNSGLYLVEVIADGKSTTQKLVINN